MKIIHALLGEHGAIRPLLDSIEASASTDDPATLKTRIQVLSAALVSHADQSPSHQGGLGASDRRLTDADDPREARRALAETVAVTRKHLEKEELVVFPSADRQLSGESQEKLGAAWAARRGVTARRGRASRRDLYPGSWQKSQSLGALCAA